MENVNETRGIMNEKIRKAAREYLERHDYEILGEPEEGLASLVCRDEGEVVFVMVFWGEGQFAEPEISRDEAECAAISYLLAHPENTFFRFDMLSVMVISADRAIVRYHQNALSTL